MHNQLLLGTYLETFLIFYVTENYFPEQADLCFV